MGNSPSLTLGDPYIHSDKYKIKSELIKWTLHLVDDDNFDRVLSAFQYEKSNINFLNNCELYLKTLRHPGVPRYVQRYEHRSESTGEERIRHLLIVDRVTPLDAIIDTISPTEVVAGIRNLLEALLFFHETASLCHNNICIQNISVDINGNWLFIGLEHMSKFKKDNKDYRQLLGVIEQIFDKIRSLGEGVEDFENRIVKDLAETPTENCDSCQCLRSLIEEPVFNNDFVEVSLFLQNFTLKSTQEKQEFFTTISQRLYNIPEKVVANRLLRHLLSRLVLLEKLADEFLLPFILTPYKDFRQDFVSPCVPILCAELFREYAIPLLFRILHVRNTHVRIALLRHLHLYVDHFPRDALQQFILPQILSGLTCDNNDVLVSESLKALALLVPILGSSAILGNQVSQMSGNKTLKFSNARRKDFTSKSGDKMLVNAKHSTTTSKKSSNYKISQSLKPTSSARVTTKSTERLQLKKSDQKSGAKKNAAGEETLDKFNTTSIGLASCTTSTAHHTTSGTTTTSTAHPTTSATTTTTAHPTTSATTTSTANRATSATTTISTTSTTDTSVCDEFTGSVKNYDEDNTGDNITEEFASEDDEDEQWEQWSCDEEPGTLVTQQGNKMAATTSDNGDDTSLNRTLVSPIEESSTPKKIAKSTGSKTSSNENSQSEKIGRLDNSLGYEYEISVKQNVFKPPQSSSGLLIDDIFSSMAPTFTSTREQPAQSGLLSMIKTPVLPETRPKSNLFQVDANSTTNDLNTTSWEDDWGDL